MKPGDIVIILGKIDQKVRQYSKEGLIKGTLYHLLCDDQVAVILENNDIWIGHIRDIVLEDEQV